MASLSLFQTLPMLIVEKVLEYLEAHTRNAFDTDIDIDLVEYNEAKTVRPLIWVSERWRVAALSIICDNCEVNFDSSPRGFSVRYPALPDKFSFSQYNMEKLVKRVVVFAPSWKDMGSGKFRITPSLPKFLVFPSAATLMVRLDEDDANPSKARRDIFPATTAVPADRNLETIRFVQSIRRLTPAATGAVVFFCSSSSTIKKNRGQCNTLVTQLCLGKTTRLHVQSWTECTLSSLSLRSVLGLTTITQGLDTACAPFAQLAYLNASTLKEFNLRAVDETNWRTIVYGDTKTPAVYSSLTKFLIGIPVNPYHTIWSAIEDAVPFPALIELDVSGDYPFNDDLLFRGNGGTLRKLAIPFKALARNVLGRFNVFSRSGVTRMNLIDIDAVDNVGADLIVGQASADIARQIHSMLEVTKILFLWSDTDEDHMLSAIKTAPNTAVIQGLELYYLPLVADDILSIISAIPSLVSLSCEIDGSVRHIGAIPEREHPAALREKYNSLNSNFRQLHILDGGDSNWSDLESDSEADHDECPCCGEFHYGSDGDYCDFDDSDDEYDDESDGGDDEADRGGLAKEAAVVAAQIAVLCPRFRHVDLPKDLRNEFSREVALAMVNASFLPYADSLERLIYPE
ncbi:hypothetical protein GGI09_003990 [Coemansia sp. S100]|nr:hypothetical protein GGI09_003990 [Coemansia sp. S100]